MLRKVRVQFHLVDGRQQPTAVDEQLQVVRLEVAHTHAFARPDSAIFSRASHVRSRRSLSWSGQWIKYRST